MKRIATFAGIMAASAAAAENRIDQIRPDAPELAAYGDHAVGVRTITVTNPGQVDVLNTPAEGDIPTYDRALTVEVWYPAADGTEPGGTYETVLRDGETQVTLSGRAARDAAPAEGATFPLVIVSHGYPGNRFLMSPLAENLASKGYVVASIDHADSTYSDQAAFGSTLVNRPWDQKAVIDDLTARDDDLGGLVQADSVGVVGYSMGGYGALIHAGAGVTQASTEYEWGAPRGLLQRNLMGSETLAELENDAIKAFVAFAPWGNNTGFWDADGLAGIEKPLMVVAGSIDDVSGYDALRGIFDGAVNAERHLLTFEMANHNAGAPMPAPAGSWEVSEKLGWAPFEHYADAVWDNVRMNNISQHFVTAFLDLHLKGDAAKAEYLDLVPVATEGVWSVDESGAEQEDHSYWAGFPNRTAAGLRFESAAPAE